MIRISKQALIFFRASVIISPVIGAFLWKGVRVVEGNGLENRRAGNGTEGSNPSPSARICSLITIRRGTQVAEGDGLLNH